jgi:predicted small lipoprotein YifL
MKKTLYLFLLIALFISACGRKSDTEYLPDAKRPKFDKVFDEKD